MIRTVQVPSQNHFARIATHTDEEGVYTRTENRDDNFAVVVATSKKNVTEVVIRTYDGTAIPLNGHEARTLFRVLEAHYANR